MNPFKGSGSAVKPQPESPEQALKTLMKSQGLKPMNQIIEQVSPAEVQSLLTRLKSQHDTAVKQTAPNSYDIEGHGIRANASYDAGAGKLTVNVFSHPFYIPVHLIQERFEEMLRADEKASGA